MVTDPCCWSLCLPAHMNRIHLEYRLFLEKLERRGRFFAKQDDGAGFQWDWSVWEKREGQVGLPGLLKGGENENYVSHHNRQESERIVS
jgi:hypothetical protein